MRIIAGHHRGRLILAPQDQATTRPITDRAKQSVFDILASRDFFAQTLVADVFAGTGSMGLEALSRGARQCVFVETHRGALRALKTNLEQLDLVGQATVSTTSAMAGIWLDLLPEPLDLIFLDPPYALLESEQTRPQILQLLARSVQALAPDGLVVLRSPRRIDLPAAPGTLCWREETFGSMRVSFWQAADSTEALQ